MNDNATGRKKTHGPDSFQEAAIKARRNSVISAGAGSGKTLVLAARYLSLVVDDGLDPESILVLTFTRKAQGEMYERIYRALAEDVRGRAALSAFSRSRISTIDSFCAEIARAGAFAYGISSDFALDNEARADAAGIAALDFVLERRASPALRDLIAGEDFTRVWQGFFANFAATRLSLVRKPDFRTGFARQREAVLKNLARAREDAADYVEELESLETGSEAQVLSVRQVVSFLKSIPETVDAASAAAFLESCSLCAVAINLRAGSKTIETEQRIKEILGGIKKAFLPVLEGNLAFLRDESRAQAILDLLEDFSVSFLESARETGILTFRETAELALASLRDDPAIRNHYKSRIRAIMVDEFQDNDPLQKDLLYYIAERPDRVSDRPLPSDLRDDALFFVGDAKQSIYRFRGADVSVFMKLKEELSSVWGEDSFIELKGNYRSERGLVDFFNGIFGRIFLPGNPKGRLDPSYSGQVPRAETAGAVSGAFAIKLMKPDDEEEMRSSFESEAWRLAEWIREKMDDESFLVPKKDGEGGRKAVRPDWSDFTVLLRVTTHQHEIETAFRKQGIPYHALNVCALYTEAPVNDIIEALKLCVYPDDLRAFAAFLRSPFVRISDEGFAKAILAAAASGTAWPDVGFLRESDAIRYETGHRIIERISAVASREGTAAAVSALWFEEGYRLAILSSGTADSLLSYYDYFFETALEADRGGLPLIEFVDGLREKQGNREKLDGVEPPEERPFGVKIMTIHKSKGLEFPVVLIPFLTSTVRPEANAGVLYWSDEYGPVFNLSRGREGKRRNPFWETENELEREKAKAELKRLFYVACTRAESVLAFSWVEKDSDDVTSDPDEGDDRERKTVSMYDFLSGALASPGGEACALTIIERDFVSQGEWFSGEESLRFPLAPADFYAKTRPPREFVPDDFSVTELTVFAGSHGIEYAIPEQVFGENRDADSDETGMDPAAFGTLVHAVIEHRLKKPGTPFLIPDSLASVPGIDKALIQAHALAERFFASEYGIQALGSPERAESEVPFLLRLGSGKSRVFLRGTMDFVFIGDEGPVVIDFKTNRGDPGSSYDAQLEAYRRAAKSLYSGTAKAGIFLLREGRFIPFSGSVHLEALCDRYARSKRGSAPGGPTPE